MVVGANGVGKSNILEAVEVLGTLRSHRSSRDQDLIQWDENCANIKALVDSEELIIELRDKGGRKIIRNGKPLKRHTDLIGSARCVCFSSLDLNLVRGDPSIRRIWLDRLVQQLEPVYSDLIGRFNKLIRHRSKLWHQLKFLSNQERNDILDALDYQMALISTRIHRRRRRALNYLQPIADVWQKEFSLSRENLRLEYLPGCYLVEEENEENLRLNIQDQLLAQRESESNSGNCKIGPHRDEINFLVNESLAKRFASSGQQRSLILALKMAELNLLEKIFEQTPILLLDDVLAELDPERQLLLLEAVGKKNQCLITATHLQAFEGPWEKDSQIVYLKS